MDISSQDPLKEIEERLAGLRPIEPRDPQRFDQGRAAFLQQARQIKQEIASNPPVSEWDHGRLIGWISSFATNFNRKERPVMFSPVVTFLIVTALLFGGAGATAYAAQDSLPADALYPVKTLTEDVQMGLSAAEDNRLELALTFAERRVNEIQVLSELGIAVPAGVVTRLGEKVEAALRIAAGLEDEAAQQALLKTMTRLRTQEQILAHLADGSDDAVLLQAREQLRIQLQLAAQGLSDLPGLRHQLQERARLSPWVIVPPGDGSANGNTNDNGNANTNDNANGNSNDDNANGNTNDDNSNDDNANGNTNDDNGNDDDSNGNGDDDDNGNSDDSNGNGDDDDNGNGDDSNGNGDDDDNGNGDDSNGNGDDDDNGDDDANDNGGSGGGDGDDNGGSGSGGGGDDDNGGSGSGGGDDDNGGSGGGGGDNSGGSGSGGGGNDD